MVKAVVDNIQGSMARLLVGDEEVAVYIPKNELPGGVRAGTVLALRFNIDHGATAARNAPKKKVFEFDPE